jgi:aspartyl protease family protein
MDIRIPLAAVLVTGGLVGLAMPTITASEGSPATATDGSQSKASDSLAVLGGAEAPDTWAEEVTLDRERDGHFYADVTVDGVPSRMLVDTGASVVALTGDDAAAMGLTWDPSAVAPVAQGASGPVYGVHTRLAQVSVGNFEAQDVDAMIIPEGLGISLLGQSFLSSVRQVQIEGDRMVLAN